MRVLVTGGAGYLGAHCVRALLRQGHEPVVVDDLSTGHQDTIPEGVPFRKGNIDFADFIRDALSEHAIDAVMHCAAKSQVAESVRDPRAYYHGNLRATMTLLDAMMKVGVRVLVATSSAAVYGHIPRVPYPYPRLHEDDAELPASPYGETKLAVERMLARYARAYGLRYIALRCFNLAGAEPGLGERHVPETHLIPRILSVAAGDAPHFFIYGTDYLTQDRTAVRDYVHVADVADGHVLAVTHLHDGGDGGVFNLGSGVGSSVREVIDACSMVTDRKISVVWEVRREGDPAALIADIQRAQHRLGWSTDRSTLMRVVSDAWRERTRPAGNPDAR